MIGYYLVLVAIPLLVLLYDFSDVSLPKTGLSACILIASNSVGNKKYGFLFNYLYSFSILYLISSYNISNSFNWSVIEASYKSQTAVNAPVSFFSILVHY